MPDQPNTLILQLYTIQDESSYHLKNEPGEIQRLNVIDDLCAGLLLQSHLLGVVHGRLSPGGDPATLVIMSFEFQGQDQARRFQHAEIKVRFADEKQPLDADPEVHSLWPEGDFSFSESQATVSQTLGSEVNASGQAVGFLSVGLAGNWARTIEGTRTDRASLKGARRIEEREWGKKNVVRLVIHENETQKSGIPSRVSAAMLLRRKENSESRFVAYVEVNAKAGKRYQAAKALRKVRGATPLNDPVIFDPASSNSSGILRDIHSDDLGAVGLESLAQVISTTMLSTVRGKQGI
ncbi:hypothetical protein PT974_10595 [Cladobotryum mycophilum]|uniref:Uncharacterized protein n=1 Tax=Cladobotryum mycophilum TaxID=491253 RepID=A0ABR0SAA3_9HYPO